MNADLWDASVHIPEPRASKRPTYDEIADRAMELLNSQQPANGQMLEEWVEAERHRRERLDREPSA
jgi:hypothetical protein